MKRGGRRPPRSPSTKPKPALDVRGTRRAPRIRIKDGVEVAVDGNPAALVDLSTVGAQVVSPTVLKPNQRVRVTIGEGKAADPLQRRRSPGRRSKCRRACRRAIAPASTSAAPPTRPASTAFAKKNKKDENNEERITKAVSLFVIVLRYFASRQPRATTLSPRMIVSSRSEPVEINPTGTPLTSSSRVM